jgi:putative peptide zinc metalloprotease protein
MISFKLKAGLRFTPQDKKYLVEDTATRSGYRIGEYEYLILKQLAEPTNVEEVGYRLRAELGVNIPYDKLNAFIQKAISLNLIELVEDSAWGRVVSSGLFASRMSFFNPNLFLESLVRLWHRSRRLWMVAGGALLLGATVISVVYFRQLWALRSFEIPAYGPFVLLFVYASSFGHELLHGLAAKYYGYDVPEVGFHMQYYIPSFYCKILKDRNADKKNIQIILLAGSVFDLAIASILVLIWFFGSGDESLREMIAFAVSLIWVKILLINLNPFLPLSDGYRILGLFFAKKRG